MTARLQSPDKQSKMDACIELAKAGPRSAPAVSAIIPLLKDPEADVRRLAAYALGEIGTAASAALPELKPMMADPDRDVVLQIVNTLRSVDPKSYSNLQNVNTTEQPAQQ
jgi:HEAT repeat protein